MASITLKEADKKYGKVHAVRGLSLDIADGEFVALLGPSGCGKSSTMRMIAGLEEITGGDILFDGVSVIRKPPGERNVAMAFESYALYPTLTVFENLAFPLRAAGIANHDVDQRVRTVAEISGLTPILDKKPAGLSSGQAQSVGLARALMREPNVLLLDEPISHLDTTRRFAMRTYIKRLHIDFGYTTILVTHDQEDAMSMADRIAVMDAGALRQIATPSDIYSKPADLFVATFVGDIPMNLLDCEYSSETKDATLVGRGWRLPLPSRFKGHDVPQTLTLGFRPYDMEPCGEDADALITRVVHVECLGDMNVALCEIADQHIQVVLPVGVRPKKDETLRLRPNEAATHLFDRSSGKAVE